MYTKIEDLIASHSRESGRLAVHANWHPDEIYHHICAFANDYYRVGGGHILVGIEKEKGIIKQPAQGLTPYAIDRIQQQMEELNQWIRPAWHAQAFVEKAGTGLCLVLWVAPGGNCPYIVPERITSTDKHYVSYIRENALTLKASTKQTTELFKRAAGISALTQYRQDNVTINDQGFNLQSNSNICFINHICHYTPHHGKIDSGAIP